MRSIKINLLLLLLVGHILILLPDDAGGNFFDNLFGKNKNNDNKSPPSPAESAQQTDSDKSTSGLTEPPDSKQVKGNKKHGRFQTQAHEFEDDDDQVEQLTPEETSEPDFRMRGNIIKPGFGRLVREHSSHEAHGLYLDGNLFLKDGSHYKNETKKRIVKPNLSHIKRKPPKKSKLLTGSYYKKMMKSAYKSTKNGILKPMAEAIVELPNYVVQVSDSLSALLKLDNKGRLLAMIDEVNKDIAFVRKEFSSFSIEWSPIMTKALNYLGAKDLNKVPHNGRDELDFRRDALYALAFGYEFMFLMIAWRENLFLAHEAYKRYLEAVKHQILHPAPGEEKKEVDEQFIYQMQAVHNYMLFSAWMDIDLISIEAKMKLEHLMKVVDSGRKDYEREYLRKIIVLQEMYEPTVEEFAQEKQQVLEAVTSYGFSAQESSDIEEFLEDFKKSAYDDEVDFDWEVPKQLENFMKEMRPELQYNERVYSYAYQKELKKATIEAREKIKRGEFI